MRKIKIRIGLLAVLMIATLAIAGCPEPNDVGGKLLTLSGTVSISPRIDVTVGTELTARYNGEESVTLSWQWKKDGSEVGSNSNKYTPDEAGDYTVTVSAKGYVSKTSNAVTVSALPDLPALPGPVTISPNSGLITTGTALSAVYSGGVSVSYQWKQGASNVGTNVTYTPTQAGSYTVTVSAAGYSSKTSAAVTVTVPEPSPETIPEAGFPGFTMPDNPFGTASTPQAALSWTTAAEDIIVYNYEDLDQIADASGGSSSSSPLIVRFTASFNRAEYIKMGEHTFDDDGYITSTTDPLRNLFEKVGSKYVYLDMSNATFDGYDDDGTLLASSGDQSSSRNSNARSRILGVAMPRTLRRVAPHLWRGTSGLATLVLRDCAALLEIGTYAFYGCGITQLDLHGATRLDHIDQYAFSNAGLRTRTNRAGLDLSSASNLTRINDRAFSGNTAEHIYLPAPQDMFIGMYAFECSKVKSLTFFGHTLVDAAWRGIPIYTDKTSGVFGTATNRFEDTDGAQAGRTDHVMEIHVPEALSPLRQYKGYLYLGDDDGYNWGGMHVPNHKTKGDIYRGQTNMLIPTRVPDAPSGTVNVYSQNTESDTYKVGTMSNGWVTLSAPASGNRQILTAYTGMEITLDPRDYHTTPAGLINNSTNDLGLYKTGSTNPDANGNFSNGEWDTAVSSVRNHYWQPWIGNPANNGGYRTSPTQFLQVKSLFYRDGGTWKEIKRSGNDTFVNRAHYYDNAYITDKHDIVYVWVAADATIKRNARLSSGYSFADAKAIGNSAITSQKYYEMGHPAMSGASLRDTPLATSFHSVHMSLKAGWNQIEVLSRYTDAPSDDGWAQIQKAVRVSAGIMGPFSTFDAGNTTNFNASAGKAYMLHYDDPEFPPTGPREYSDEGKQIQVPWILVQ